MKPTTFSDFSNGLFRNCGIPVSEFMCMRTLRRRARSGFAPDSPDSETILSQGMEEFKRKRNQVTSGEVT
jgi:hypothetical protein